MKALIRNPGETVTENDGIVGIDWNTGAPLTNPSWASGPYRLVEDYQEPEPIQSTPVEEKPAEQPSEALSETVTYGGKEYTLEELKKLIG